MADTGWVIFGSGANVDYDEGSVNWANLTNIAADDGNYVTCGLGAVDTSEYLQATDASLNALIPANATIKGIEIKYEAYTSGLSNGIGDIIVSIVKGGAMTGDNKARNAIWDLGTPTVYSYGSSSDLWGTSWTRSEAVNIGLNLAAYNFTSAGRTGYVDYIAVKITYAIYNKVVTLCET